MRLNPYGRTWSNKDMRKKLTKKEKQARAALREIERKLEAKLHEIHDARNREVGMYV